MYLADERDVFQLMGVLTQLIQGLTQSLKTSQLRDSVGFCTNLSPLISVVGCQRLATSYHGSIGIEIEVIRKLGKAKQIEVVLNRILNSQFSINLTSRDLPIALIYE